MKSVILMKEPDEKLWQAFEAASREIKKSPTTAQGGQRAEDNYSIAYQNLIKNNGCVMQIKGKYR